MSRMNPLKRKKPFNKVEEFLLPFPTWGLVTLVVLIFVFLVLWAYWGTYNDLGGILRVLLQNAEAIAIIAGLTLYFKEIPDRKSEKHYKAWQVFDNAAGVKGGQSYALKKALEDLCKDGVSLARISVSWKDLFFADLSFGYLRGSSFTMCNFTKANLSGADFSSADLFSTNFTAANLHRADFTAANILHCNFTGADLSFADLSMRDFEGVNLSGADLFKANLRGATNLLSQQIRLARNWETAMYDPGFREELGLDT